MTAVDDTDSTESYLWQTLGYRRTALAAGNSAVEWDAPVAYCFPAAGGPIVQGGMVTALLDAAMGSACWSVLDDDQSYCQVRQT